MYTYNAHVTKVYDGDTITVDIDLGLGVWVRGQKIRLARIDAPELRGEEHDDGIKSRDFLRKLVLGKDIVVVTHKDRKEKWGRWLGDIYLPADYHDSKNNDLDLSVNSVILEHNYAVPMDTR